MTTAPIGSREFAKRQLHGGLCSDDLLPPDSMLAGVPKKPLGGKSSVVFREQEVPTMATAVRGDYTS